MRRRARSRAPRTAGHPFLASSSRAHRAPSRASVLDAGARATRRAGASRCTCPAPALLCRLVPRHVMTDSAPSTRPPVPILRPDAARFSFPADFLWGASTSAQQVEGDNVKNDWAAWEEAGHVRVLSGLACDHYRRFREDFDLARNLAHNAHRFSLVWS